MAKNRATKVKKGVSENDRMTLCGIKACELAGKRLRTKLENKKARLEPNSYAVSMNLEVGGDVVVEPNQTVKETQSCRFTDADLLVGLMVGLTTEEATELIGRAIAANKEAEKTGAAGVRFEHAESLLSVVIEKESRKRGVWDTKPESQKAGKTLGAPSVRLTGTVDSQRVVIDVEAGQAGGDDDDAD